MPRASSEACPADRRPPGRAGSPARSRDGGSRVRSEVGEQSPRLVPARRGPPECRRAPSSAAPGGGCSARFRASIRHTCRHTPHCDSPAVEFNTRNRRELDARENEAGVSGRPGGRRVARRSPPRPAHFSAWAPAQKIDEIAGQQLGAEHAVRGRLPDPVPGRPQPVHGLDPSRWPRPARHLGRPPAEQGRPVGRTGEPRRAGQLGRRRLLPDADPRRRPLLRQQGSAAGKLRAGDIYFTRSHPRGTAGASRSTSPARPTAPTARSTSRARPT